jgi:hypothetical protein
MLRLWVEYDAGVKRGRVPQRHVSERVTPAEHVRRRKRGEHGGEDLRVAAAEERRGSAEQETASCT